MARVFAAVDIGASGGRVMAGVVDGGEIALHTMHRFTHGIEKADGHLRWNLSRLFDEVVNGLRAAAKRFPQVESIGIDTWAVDYGLLDAGGRLLAEPVSYRDGRTDAEVVERVHRQVRPDELYAVNGLQFLPFNTLYQLEAEKASPLWHQAAHALLLPDLLAYWLTGVMRTEVTNASTTGLLDVRQGTWSSGLFDRLDLPAGLFPPLETPGATRGKVLPRICAVTGLGEGTIVTTIGSHDTASAVVGVPASDERFAYVSSGTWSLAGVELREPVLTDESRSANFTNEGGVDGRIRFLRNVGGLWLLQESLRHWESRGADYDLASLLTEAETLPLGGPIVDVDDPSFIAPGNMPSRIEGAASLRGVEIHGGPAGIVRCILDSLAAAYAKTVAQAEALAQVQADVIHMVGGGSQNALLCQLTAKLSGKPVTAGPAEATAIGNIVIQARAHGAAPDSLEDIRFELSKRSDIRRYQPA